MKGKTMHKLREEERKTLLTLQRLYGKATVGNLTRESGLSKAAATRAAIVLQEKGLVEIKEKRQTTMKLNQEGRTYAKKGLPERRLISVLEELDGKAPLDNVIERGNLGKFLTPIALGWIRKKKWARLNTETNMLQVSGEFRKGPDERLIALLGEEVKLTVENLDPELQAAFLALKGRKLLDVEERTQRTIEITRTGQTMTRSRIKTSTKMTQLTPELIINGKWRKAEFQEYDVRAEVAKTWAGKKHPYLRFLDKVKEKLVNLGFKEMIGPIVETSFFHFDALYTPQNHPARESLDIFLVKSPKYGNMNCSEHTLQNVKKTHENGWKTGSTGWRYKYSSREARRLMLRGHGTALSVRTLLNKDLEIPGKYFSFARCFRPEVLDKTHLVEFNQVEGIVVEEDLSLRDLLGILKTFAFEIAEADEVRLKPDYYPFTEPSVELSAYKKGYGWIEFGGSGIFRPEVTMPLGIKAPVIAWGLGIDRLYMIKAGIDDIRGIFSKDLGWIRRKEVV
jgi:phenylalanyl-tRNA synthetase alpha chain